MDPGPLFAGLFVLYIILTLFFTIYKVIEEDYENTKKESGEELSIKELILVFMIAFPLLIFKK